MNEQRSGPTSADLTNKKVSLRRWKKNARYSRLTITKGGVRFTYDTSDKCWRPLNVPIETPERAARARAHSVQLRDKRIAANRARAGNPKVKKAVVFDRVLKALTLTWFRSMSAFVCLIALLMLNGVYLPAFPIVALAVGGALSCAGIVIAYGMFGRNGPQDRGAVAIFLMFALIGLMPLVFALGLHGIVALIVRVS